MTFDRLIDQFATLNGQIERPVAMPRWPVAKRIQLDKDRLVWQPGSADRRWIEPEPGLLTDFLALRDGKPEDVLAYARRWGVLYLCEHDFPQGHPPGYWPTRPNESHACPFDKHLRLTPRALKWDRYRERMDKYSEQFDAHIERGGPPEEFDEQRPKLPKTDRENVPRTDFHRCESRGYHTGTPWEPVEAWREWARRAYALLAVAAALRENKPGTTADWLAATGSEDWRCPKTAEDSWRDLAYMTTHWLGAANVRPRIELAAVGGVRLRLGSTRNNSPLFGALAIQLALAVCGAEGFALCDGCKTIYAPTRKPRANQRSYCKDCRDKGVPQRHAVADWRERQKGKTKKKPTRRRRKTGRQK